MITSIYCLERLLKSDRIHSSQRGVEKVAITLEKFIESERFYLEKDFWCLKAVTKVQLNSKKIDKPWFLVKYLQRKNTSNFAWLIQSKFLFEIFQEMFMKKSVFNSFCRILEYFCFHYWLNALNNIWSKRHQTMATGHD